MIQGTGNLEPSAIEPRDLEPRDLEQRVQQIGAQLLREVRQRQASLWTRTHWEETVLRKLMGDEYLRVQLLRFIDVLPTLTDDADLVQHLHEYFQDESLPLPPLAKWGARWGMAHSGAGIPAHLLARAVRAAMNGLARRFIGGTDAEEAYHTAQGLRQRGMGISLDVLGEATVSEAEAEGYQAHYLQLLEDLAPRLAGWPEHPLLDRINGRPSPRLNLSIKCSSLYSQLSAQDPEGSAEAICERLRPILRRAKQWGASMCLDMEHYQTKHIVLKVFRDILLETEFRDWPDAGIAIQAYLRDAEADIQDLRAWAKQRGTPITVRLVRGAYWDYETVIAGQHGWPVPVWTEKGETDRCYERCLRLLFDHHPYVETAVATHNARSLALAMAFAQARGLDPSQYELQMLYGMADPLKDTVAAMGLRLRVYVPFGELLPGMAYLVRRLLENTASQSFLRMGFVEDLPAEVLLASPYGAEMARAERLTAGREGRPNQPSVPLSLGPFCNEPVHRFTDAAERAAFAAAIERVRGELGQDYAMVIHGREVFSGDFIVSINPARPREIVGRVAAAKPEHAEQAVQAALAAFQGWRDLPAMERAGHLVRTASLLRAQRDEFAAWEVFEAGKGWAEADADVAEAIDYLEYYAREMLRLAAGHRWDVAGETNAYVYEPRGVGVVIAPWNFPLAILSGMLSAAIVAGNTVVLKPSSYTPVIAARFMKLLSAAGLPEGVVNLVTGPGGEVGEYLVRHPKVQFVTFTGSREVGSRIFRLGAELQAGQLQLKRVIAEMGGKNAIVVDGDADLDEAVLGTVTSALGYQGQKCSAASRVIVLDGLYDKFVHRLAEATRSLLIGPPEDPGNFIGPVIDGRARGGIERAIEAGKQVAVPVLEVCIAPLDEGFYVGPTVFRDVPPESPLAQEEIFGPVLAVLRAQDFEHAIALANGTSYALTGGVYSRLPSHLTYAAQRFQVGNLYLNRKITGARVGRQPFGGF